VLLGPNAALLLAMALAVLTDMTVAVGRGWARRLPAWTGEITVLLVLYSTWQLGLGIIADHTRGAVARGLAVWRFERALGIGRERAFQRAVIHAPSVMRALNYFYAVGHVQDVMIVLVWLFWRHRDRYVASRRVLVALIGLCALVQAFPVAPPRLLPQTGVVDAGRLLGYALYPLGGLHDSSQLTAMPSVHVAMAAWVTWVVLTVSTSRWRGLILAHLAATFAAVIAPGYHFWLDGIVAIGILAAVVIGQREWARRAATHSQQIDSGVTFSFSPTGR